MRYKRLLLILFTLFYGIAFAIDLKESEASYLASKTEFIVMVSNDNFPYEYINEKEEIAGINVQFIKKILAFTKKPVIFITERTDQEPDIISSFVQKGQHHLHTEALFLPEVYLLYPNDTGIDDIERFIVVNQAYLLYEMQGRYPETKFIVSDNLKKALYMMHAKPNTAVVFDSFNKHHLRILSRLTKDTTMEPQLIKDIQFHLTVNNADLFSMLSKSIERLKISNTFYRIYRSFEDRVYNTYLLYSYDNILFIIIIGLSILIILNMVFFYIFKMHQFKLEQLNQNITKENEALLLEKESLLIHLETFKTSNNHLLENLNSFAFILDLKGNIIFVNQYSRVLLGYPPESLIGHNIDEILSKEHKQKILSISKDDNVNPIMQESYDSKSAEPYEVEIVSKEGLRKNFIFSTLFSKTENDTTHIYCILQDISEKKRMEKQVDAYTQYLEDVVEQRLKDLRESEEKFRFVINSAYDSIFMIQDFDFTLVNEAFYTMTGVPEANVKDKTTKFIDIISPDLRQNVIDEIDKNSRVAKKHFVIDTKIMRYDGDLLAVEIHFTRLDIEDKLGLLGIIHDIEQKKEHELVKEQATKMKTLTEYAITTNDTINSPLTAIQGYVEMLESHIARPEPIQKKAFANIYKSINIIKTILQELVKKTEYDTKKYNLGNIDMININIKKEDANGQ